MRDNDLSLPRFLSVNETARTFGVTAAAIRGWLKRGTLPARKIGRRVFVSVDAIEAIQSHEFHRPSIAAKSPERTGSG